MEELATVADRRYKDHVESGATSDPLTRDPEAVRSMFARIARRYDLANHLLSGGLDFWWRIRAAEIVRRWNPRRVLDLATGSGDLALTIGRKLPRAEIIGADFCAQMLKVAEAKGLTNTIVADAMHLPFGDASFDVVTIAFGLRNVSDWRVALSEMARVLAPGGHLLVLDFSLPRGWLSRLYRIYLHRAMPWLAQIVTGEKQAYDYLGASIEKFPSGEEMYRLIEVSGFTDIQSQPLSGGIVTIYSASVSS